MTSSPELSCGGLSFPLSAPTERKGVSSPHFLSEYGAGALFPPLGVPQSLGPSLKRAAVLSGLQSLLVALTSVSIAGALFRTLQIGAPQRRLGLHPRAQDCPVFQGAWGRGTGEKRGTRSQLICKCLYFPSPTPSPAGPRPCSSSAELQFPTSPFFRRPFSQRPPYPCRPDSCSRS